MSRPIRKYVIAWGPTPGGDTSIAGSPANEICPPQRERWDL
jgi:hypothetical protein